MSDPVFCGDPDCPLCADFRSAQRRVEALLTAAPEPDIEDDGPEVRFWITAKGRTAIRS